MRVPTDSDIERKRSTAIKLQHEHNVLRNKRDSSSVPGMHIATAKKTLSHEGLWSII